MWQLRLLCYHAILPEHAAAFEAQLRDFQDRGWRFTSLSTALNDKPDGRWACVSFDDGDRTVSEVAQPVLDALGIKAIHYISTDFVAQGRLYGGANPRPAGTWDQLGHWLQAGHEIGSHTHTHARMSAISNEKQRDELEQSRQLIKSRLDLEPVHFAYPWGAHNRRTHSVIQSTGQWKSAATIDRGWNTMATDPLLLRRDVLEPSWSASHIRRLFALAACPPLYWLQARDSDSPEPVRRF